MCGHFRRLWVEAVSWKHRAGCRGFHLLLTTALDTLLRVWRLQESHTQQSPEPASWWESIHFPCWTNSDSRLQGLGYSISCVTVPVVFTRWKVRSHGQVLFKKCGYIQGYGGLRVQDEQRAKLQAIPHCALYWSWDQHAASSRASTHWALHTLQAKQGPKWGFYGWWGTATWQVCSTQYYYDKFLAHVKTFRI